MKGGSESRAAEGARDHRSQSNAGHMNRNERNARDENRGPKNERNAKEEDHSPKNQRNAQDERSKTRTERNARSDDTGHKDDNRKRAEEHRGGAATGASEGTAGRSGASKGSVANVTADQKTRIGTIFLHHHAAPVRNLNVAVNVGVAIPRSVHVYPMPADIVTIVPEYRDYMYFMIDDDRVAIVDPDTYEVVDIIVIA
jgi:hypothetical protein